MFKQRWQLAKKWYWIKSRPSLLSSEQRESVQTRRAETKCAKHVLRLVSSTRFFPGVCLLSFEVLDFVWTAATVLDESPLNKRRPQLPEDYWLDLGFFTPSFVSAFLASANWKLRETNTTRADNVCRCSRTYLNIGVTPNRHPHGDDGMSAAPCLQRNSREVQLSPRLRKKTCLRTLLAKYVNHCTWEGRYDDKSLQTITVFGSDNFYVIYASKSVNALI